MIFLVCNLLLWLGFGCFIACLCGENSAVCITLSSLFFAYLLPCLHELGHILGCKFTKAKIAKIHLLFWSVENGKANISQRLLPFKVSFYSGKNDFIVYICGILASLLLALISGGLYAIFKAAYLLPPLFISIAVFLFNLLGKNSDLNKAIHCLKHGE